MAPRKLHAVYHPDRLVSWLSVLFWLSIIGAALGVLVGSAAIKENGFSAGWAIISASLTSGVGGAIVLAVFRAAVTLLEEIREAAIETHNLIGEQATEAKPEPEGRRYVVASDGQVVTKGR